MHDVPTATAKSTGYAETKDKKAKMKAVMKFYTDPGRLALH